MNFRRTLSVFLAAASCLVIGRASGAVDETGVSPQAGSVYEDGSFQYEISTSERTASVAKYIGESSEVTVPHTVTIDGAGYDVISIGDNAFSNSTKTEKVVLQDGIKTIGYAAFVKNQSLTEVTIPDSVSAIAGFAFAQCESLSHVQLPNSLKIVSPSTFQGCTALTSVTFPPHLETIQTKAFKGCTSLTAIELPASLTLLNVNAFEAGTSDLEVQFNGTPIQWDKLTGAGSNGQESWFDSGASGRRAEVTCAMTADQVDRDIVYRHLNDTWTAILHPPVPVSGWTLTMPASSENRSSQATSSTQNAAIEIQLQGSPGTRSMHTVRAACTGEKVTAAALCTVPLEVGWTPQDIGSWVTVRSAAPTSGDEIEIELKPVAGTVDAELDVSAESSGALKLVSGTSRSISSSSAPYIYRAKVSAPRGGDIHLRLSGSFSSENGHGTFDAQLPIIAVAAAPQPEPTPTITREPEPTKQPEPTPTPTAVPTEEPLPSPSPTVAPDDKPSSTPSPTNTPSPSATSTPAPLPSATSTPPQPTDTPEPSPSAGDPQPPKLKDDSDLLIAGVGGDSMLKGTMPNGADLGLDAGSLKNEFDLDHGIIVEIVDHSGARVEDSMPLATGYEVVFRRSDNGTVISRFPIVVQGDVIGTGYMSLTQLVRHAQGYTGVKELTGCYLSAGDFNNNERIDLSDLVQEARLYRRER